MTVGLLTNLAHAESAASQNYQVIDSSFGSGDANNSQSCSAGFCATVSIGDIVSGKSSSSTMTAFFGKISSDEPLLEMIIAAGNSDLGNLSTTQTATKTIIIKVRNYMSDGYTLQIRGTAPKFDGRSLHTDSAPTLSSPGIEQFGLNLVANTIPEVGADLVYDPVDQGQFGLVNSNYATPNRFMYQSGATVARSDIAFGQTDYTVSMIINIANNTPAGHYSSDFSAVVVPVY